MTNEIRSYDNLNKVEYDLQSTAGYKKYWTSKQTECNWTSNCLHWHHYETFFNKLPKPHIDQIKKMWESRPNDVPDTLGGRIRTVELYLQDLCVKKHLYKQKYNTYNNRICCNNLNIDVPGKYGCKTYKKPKYKNKFTKHYKKKYRFRPIPYKSKYKRPKYRNKYFKKKYFWS